MDQGSQIKRLKGAAVLEGGGFPTNVLSLPRGDPRGHQGKEGQDESWPHQETGLTGPTRHSSTLLPGPMSLVNFLSLPGAQSFFTGNGGK